MKLFFTGYKMTMMCLQESYRMDRLFIPRYVVYGTIFYSKPPMGDAALTAEDHNPFKIPCLQSLSKILPKIHANIFFLRNDQSMYVRWASCIYSSAIPYSVLEFTLFSPIACI